MRHRLKHKGLHYVGDKLGLLQRASRWTRGDGLLMMHVDYRNLRIPDNKQSGAQIGRDLHRAGFQYLPGRHLLIRKGSTSCNAFRTDTWAPTTRQGQTTLDRRRLTPTTNESKFEFVLAPHPGTDYELAFSRIGH